MRTIWLNCLRRAAFARVIIYELLMRLFTAIRYKNKTERKKIFKQLRYQAELKYLNRYSYVFEKDKIREPSSDVPKIIWTCWWQGTENLPPVVEKCIASIRKYCPDYELRIVTADNMHDYVNLPDYIMQKHKKGNITRTQLSDLLRLELLTKYGGMWLDATVFLTAPLPDKILSAPFFAFHCREIYQAQSWFLKAKSDNIILHNLKNLMFEYWRRENKMINYFLVYLSFDAVVKNNLECAKMWAQTPLIYDDCYELADNFFAPYSAQKWAAIKAKTTIHKLSWKYKKTPESGTFLARLLDGETED